MPNLKQIYALKNEYFKLENRDRKTLDYIEKSETRDILNKAFESGRLDESVRRDVKLFSFINEDLNPDKPELIKYFDEAKEEDVALLFIDITSFSKTIASWSNTEIKNYLDDYYERIIPIIYKHGGEIEKLMGDGIICVFGKPFLQVDYPEYVYHAEDCAEKVIKEFHGSNKNVKVAIHKGIINYYKVPGDHYGEYTMIGQSITELYRLESISQPNAINFYDQSSYDKLGWRLSRFDNTLVSCRGYEINQLQGVDFKSIKYMKFPNYD